MASRRRSRDHLFTQQMVVSAQCTYTCYVIAQLRITGLYSYSRFRSQDSSIRLFKIPSLDSDDSRVPRVSIPMASRKSTQDSRVSMFVLKIPESRFRWPPGGGRATRVDFRNFIVFFGAETLAH